MGRGVARRVESQAFVGDPWDERTWSVLDPLAPHALAVAHRADEARIVAPTTRLLNLLGLFLCGKARYSEAGPLYRRALAIDEANRGPDHPEVTKRLNNLALLCNAANHLDEAELPVGRALAIDAKSLGPDHPAVAGALNTLASVLRDRKRVDEAEPLVRRALAICEASLVPNHPSTANARMNLAALNSEIRVSDFDYLHKDANGAERFFQLVLAICEQVLGPDNPDVAKGLFRLLRDANRIRESEPLYRRAPLILEKNLGTHDQRASTALNDLAAVLQAANRATEAEPLYRRAVAICEKHLGTDHPNSLTARKNLAALEAERGRGT